MCGHPLEDVQRARDPPLNIFPAYKHQLPIAPQLRVELCELYEPRLCWNVVWLDVMQAATSVSSCVQQSGHIQ